MSKKITKTKAKKAVKAAKKHPVAAIVIVAVILAVVIAAVVLYLVKPDLYHKHLGIGGHTYSAWSTTEATCDEDGARKRHCTVCGEEETEVIPATGIHTYTDWKTDKEADCGNDGKKSRHCTECGEEETETIPKTGDHQYGSGDSCVVCGYNPNKPVAEATEFSIHFLELGNGNAGDSILIDCGDTEVLIDAGSQQSSASTIKKYVDQYCTDNVLEYVISTHADTDHISGFLGTAKEKGIFYQYEIGTLIKFDNSDKSLTTSGGGKSLYAQYLDAVNTLNKDNGTNVYTASQCYEEKDGAQRQYYLDETKTVSINILYNYYYYNTSSDENNHSVVTLLTQELASGNKHYLFTGDLEESGESKMVDYYSNPANSKSEFDILPKVELYKAGHHGSKTSSTAKLLQVIQPEYVAVCCVCGQPEYTKENANTFPTQQMLDNVGKWTDKIYVTTLATDLPEKDENGNYTKIKKTGNTSMNGDIRFFIKGEELELKCTNGNTILKDTEWFKENRTWNGV